MDARLVKVLLSLRKESSEVNGKSGFNEIVLYCRKICIGHY